MKKPLITIGIIAAVMASLPLCVAMLALYDAVRAWAWLIVPLLLCTGIVVVLLLAASSAVRIAGPAYGDTVQKLRHAPVHISENVALAAPRADGQAMAGAMFVVTPPRSYHYHQTGDKVIGQGNTIEQDTPTDALMAPTMGRMLADGMMGDGIWRMGLTPDGVWRGLDLRTEEPPSLLVAGQTQAGKSNTQAFYIAQLAMMGAKVGLIDHHARANRSLHGRLAPLSIAFDGPPALTVGDAQAVLGRALAVMEDRFYRGYSPADGLYVLAVDEMNGLAKQLGTAFMAGIERILQEGAKVGVILIANGQDWTGGGMGSTTASNAAPGKIIHRLAEGAARHLPGLSGMARTCAGLSAGQGLLMLPSDDTSIVAVPLVTSQDMAALAARLEQERRAASITGRMPLSFSASPIAPQSFPLAKVPLALADEEQKEAVDAAMAEDASTEWPADLLAMVYRMVLDCTEQSAMLGALRDAYPRDKWAVNGGNYNSARDRLAAIKAALLGDDTIRHRAVTRLRELQGG